jgi:HupE/UreJ protein
VCAVCSLPAAALLAVGVLAAMVVSGRLRESQLNLPAQGLLASLFGFNVGVEVGQALVVAGCLPLLLLLRRSRWETRTVATSSLAILVVGLVLCVERAFF